MRLRVPIPFGEIAIDVGKGRSGRPLFWSALISLIFHLVLLVLLAAFFLRASPVAEQPERPLMVTISSALHIENRPRPLPAHHLAAQPVPLPPQPQPQQQQPKVEQQKVVPPKRVIARQPPRREAPRGIHPPTLTAAQIQHDMQRFQQTIALARSKNDPVQGAADETPAAAAPHKYSLNIGGDLSAPHPEGVLYPVRRWVDGPYAYYYVRYEAEYADGSVEYGDVPWPIRFPLSNDPFAHNIHHMPLPGPPAGYVAAADVAMSPLVKNCYDHHYDYCPIEHE